MVFVEADGGFVADADFEVDAADAVDAEAVFEEADEAASDAAAAGFFVDGEDEDAGFVGAFDDAEEESLDAGAVFRDDEAFGVEVSDLEEESAVVGFAEGAVGELDDRVEVLRFEVAEVDQDHVLEEGVRHLELRGDVEVRRQRLVPFARSGRVEFPLSEVLLGLARRGPFVAEVAAGRRFDTALAFHEATGMDVLVTDVDPRVLEAPRELRAKVDDLLDPKVGLYEGAALIYAQRIPEELQLAAARLAHRVGAPLALRPLKDEWADVREVFPRYEQVLGGWRLYRP